jgi:hypothetical protein
VQAFVGDEGKRIVAVTSVSAARAVVNWTERDPIPRQNMLSSSVLYAVGKYVLGFKCSAVSLRFVCAATPSLLLSGKQEGRWKMQASVCLEHRLVVQVN